jgi:NSS family neurotransmitter:Na+ symporter
MADSEGHRGNWGSKLAFIFAASGSAIGLGSLWRFPLYTGRNGGAVFVFTYVIAVFFIGFTVMLVELTIGRHAQKNPVGAFEHIKPGSAWKFVGYLGVLSGVAILSFYGVIAGWSTGYFYKTVVGAFPSEISWDESAALFGSFVANPVAVLSCLVVTIAITSFVISKGVKDGIERWSKILMPVLFVLVIVMAIRALMLPGAKAGLVFYLKPDLSGLTPSVVFYAVGQAFFSLSLGMGTMMTYGSYLDRKDNLVSSAGWVCFSTTFVAILAGIIIFPTLFDTLNLTSETFTQQFEVDTGLMFQVFPIIISQMPGGYFFGVGFFTLLLIAALTSTISMLEVPTAYLVDERGWSRTKASYSLGVVAFVFGVPAALSAGGSDFFTNMDFLGKMDLIFGNISLAVGGLFMCLFVAYIWKFKNVYAEIANGNKNFWLRPIWTFNVAVTAPIAVIAILTAIFWRMFTG